MGAGTDVQLKGCLYAPLLPIVSLGKFPVIIGLRTGGSCKDIFALGLAVEIS